MMMTRHKIILSAMAIIGLFGVGCSQQTVDDASKDVNRNLQAANKEAEELGAKAKPALNKLDLGVRVTTALRANANLPNTIHVDADASGVRLKGDVSNEHQKALAGKVAQQTLPEGKTVSNELIVKG